MHVDLPSLPERGTKIGASRTPGNEVLFSLSTSSWQSIYMMITDPEMFYCAACVVLLCTSTSKRTLKDCNAGSALPQGQPLRRDITDQQ